MTFPAISLIRQIAPQPTVSNVPETVYRLWLESPLAKRIAKGARIAIGCGSRGIAGYQAIVQATIRAFRELGAEPFILAAMGSHGGATADGQRQLLAEYGITEAALGVPVKTDMDARQIGTNSWGEPVWWDANGLAADGVVNIARIKPHTDYQGPFESGITKMAVIGLGKREGAAQHHRWGWRGLREMLPETAKVILAKTPFLGGLGILENAHEQTAHLQVVDRDELLQVEPILLDRARTLMGRLPFDELDVLIIGEIGKNYSGAGIDPNVVGRFLVETKPELDMVKPKITRICALDISPESHGNATGVGIADLTTERLLAAIDPVPFRMNNFTACFLWRSKIPFAFPTDRECLQAALATCWQPNFDQLRLAIIPNTLEVAEMWVTEPLAAIARTNADLSVEGRREIPFDATGTLIQEELFPHSVRGRRKKKH